MTDPITALVAKWQEMIRLFEDIQKLTDAKIFDAKAVAAAYGQCADELDAVRQAQQGWQPIKTDTNDGEMVLVWWPSMDPDYPMIAWQKHRVWRSEDVGSYEIGPTHWMPLPSPPVASPLLGEAQQQTETNDDDLSRVDGDAQPARPLTAPTDRR